VVCNSGTAFGARIDGRRLSFEEMGIYNGVFVMRDHQTRSIWSHYTGEALDGPLKGKRLPWIQLRRANLDRLAELHPQATSPVRSSLRFREKPIPLTDRVTKKGDKLSDNFRKTLPSEMGELKLHTHGLGVAVKSKHRFYPIDLLYGANVINDTVDGVDVVVLVQDGSATAAAYARCVDGATRSFEPAEHRGQAALRDDQGTVWDATGTGVAGPGKGKKLTSVRSIVTDWYGWVAYFQRSDVYKAPAAPAPPAQEGAPKPG
jgi:hypothetical protein